jgi:ParB-like chromosome segregation protein Spo0J
MIIPDEWITEAGVQNFRPAPSQRGFRCDAQHELIALSDIEVPLRFDGYPLDANGFDHTRMVRLLAGIRDGVALPPINVELGDPGQRKYRVRCGVHRYHASQTLGFSHVPAEVVPRY